MHFYIIYILLDVGEILVAKILLEFSAISSLFPLLILAWQIICKMVLDKLVDLLVYIFSITDKKAK